MLKSYTEICLLSALYVILNSNSNTHCTQIHIHTRACARAQTHTHTHTRTRTHSDTHTQTHAHTHTHTHARTHARTHAHTHARTYTHTHTLHVMSCHSCLSRSDDDANGASAVTADQTPMGRCVHTPGGLQQQLCWPSALSWLGLPLFPGLAFRSFLAWPSALSWLGVCRQAVTNSNLQFKILYCPLQS